jgi:hypothetical protein
VKATLATLLLAASVLLPHWPRERAEFTYDDREFIETNQSIRSLGEAFAVWLAPFPPDQPDRGLYRPLTSLSYALDFQLGGGDARAFHRTNILLYGAVVAMVFHLALAYGRGFGFALSLALLFAVHPVHCDAVDAIAGRSELLSLLFSLASLIAFLKARRFGGPSQTRRWLAVSATAYALASLAKETGVVLPAILAVHAWVLPFDPRAQRGGRRVNPWHLVPYAGVLALYLVARFAALGQFAPAEPLMRGVPFEIRLRTLGSVFIEYLRLLVFPDVLQIDFYYRLHVGIAGDASVRSLAGLALFSAAGGTLAWLLLHPDRSRDRLPSEIVSARALATCALALFLGFLFPVSHLLDLEALMAERFLFAPSTGFLLLVVLAGASTLERMIASPGLRRGATVALVGALALAGALRSAARAAEWRDPVALWVAADRDLPNNFAIRANLAAALIDRGDLDAAGSLLEENVVRYPNEVLTLSNLGLLRLRQRRFEEARSAFERVLKLRPGDVVTWNNLGALEMRRNRPVDALACFRRALELNPNFAEARRNLEATEGQIEAARRAGG